MLFQYQIKKLKLKYKIIIQNSYNSCVAKLDVHKLKKKKKENLQKKKNSELNDINYMFKNYTEKPFEVLKNKTKDELLEE